ncbi:hypothetical protein L596_028477 [Steinernema carpocapsae]|uniref:Uncharacterized protein n=1 Tax=Steinernema carpocapsae TaxID=34508 RepID=A0A4U5LYM0_STECR|nr:hypothetical protein L596_028477 [Steinernema carpocapsae]
MVEFLEFNVVLQHVFGKILEQMVCDVFLISKPVVRAPEEVDFGVLDLGDVVDRRMDLAIFLLVESC